MPKSPINEDHHLVSFYINVDGTRIKDTVEVMSISIELDQSGIQLAEVSIRDGYGDHPFEVTQSGEFKLGRQIEIGLGYMSKETKVFSGTIVSNDVEQHEKKGIVLTIDSIGKSSNAEDNAGAASGLKLTYGYDVMDFHLSRYKNELDGNETTTEGALLFTGSHLAEPGKSIDLDGFAVQYNGAYDIKQVHHLVSDGQWTTEIEI